MTKKFGRSKRAAIRKQNSKDNEQQSRPSGRDRYRATKSVDKNERPKGSSFKRHGGSKDFDRGWDADKEVVLDAKHKEKALAKTLEYLKQNHQDPVSSTKNASPILKSVDESANDFKLDDWQQEAVNHLLKGADLIIDAPTTAGKTRVVEAFFRANINDPSFRAAYTTPVKSLSNDKVRELRAMFGAENVGIATGDIKENLGAPIVVATLECYRNSLLGTEPDLGRNLVVFDEYHFMQDESRGSAWEESIILSPPSCQLLLLSASVANVFEFVGWLQKIRPTRAVERVIVEHRPVPLVDLVYVDGDWILKTEIPQHIFDKSIKAPTRGRIFPIRQELLVPRLKKLEALHLTPCMIYVGRRGGCEKLATILCKNLEPLPQEESEKIGEVLTQLHQEKKVLSFLTPAQRRSLQSYGVGYHHSGLAVPARYAIEVLVKRGMLRYCVATMGLSVGINFAVRSACISDFERPGEQGFVLYPPAEVLQMLGRAGRRGRDLVGYSLWPDLEAYARLGGAKREECSSRLRNDPATFLGLIGRGFSLKDMEQFYEKSFRRYREHNTDFALASIDRVKTKLKVNELPCKSPAYELASYFAKENDLHEYLRSSHDSKCYECPLKKACHQYLQLKLGGSLAALHVHLHMLHCLNEDETLTACGDVAKYIPQAGGLLLAQMIIAGKIDLGNLASACELIAALSLARFKEPQVPSSYRFPFEAEEIEESLKNCYPQSLFPELYEQNNSRDNDVIQMREFNPSAGFIVRQWLSGCSWNELVSQVAAEGFGPGDIMAVLYRVSTYLQSVSQLRHGSLSSEARKLRDIVLREPLSYVI